MTNNAALPVSNEVAQQVRAEAATAKPTSARRTRRLHARRQAPRIFKADDKGNRTYLNEAELDEARLQARRCARPRLREVSPSF